MDPFRRASQPQLATTLPLYSGSETVGSQSVRPAVSVVLGQARRARPIIPAHAPGPVHLPRTRGYGAYKFRTILYVEMSFTSTRKLI